MKIKEFKIQNEDGEEETVKVPKKILDDFFDDTASLKKRFTSRKLIFTAITFVIGTYFLYVGLINPDHWIELIKWVSIVYFGANVGDKFTQALKSKFRQLKNTI